MEYAELSVVWSIQIYRVNSSMEYTDIKSSQLYRVSKYTELSVVWSIKICRALSSMGYTDMQSSQ